VNDKSASFVYLQRPIKICKHVNELLIRVCLNNIKTVIGCILTNTLQQLRGNTLSLHFGCNCETKYRFHLDTGGRLSYVYGNLMPQPTDTVQTIGFGICVAPTNNFTIVKCQVALNHAAVDVLDGQLSPLFWR